VEVRSASSTLDKSLFGCAVFVVRVCEALIVTEADELLQTAIAAVAAFGARSAYAMSDDEVRSSLRRLQGLATVVAGAAAAIVQEAAGRDIARHDGAASTVAWLRDVLRISPVEASRMILLGQIMNRRSAIAAAVESGAVNPAQALAIGHVLDDVAPEEPAILDKVEAVLIDHATQFEPAILRRLGQRVLAHVSPDRADARLRDTLEREERLARQRRGFTLSSDGLGGTRISGVLDAEGAAIVAAAIEPLARPVRDDNSPDLRTAPARRADALVEVCRIALAAGGLPDNGGIPPQLNITVDFDALARDLAVGQLDTGAVLSPSATRRLACEAQILPVMLDGHSVPIDLGRSRRPFTGAARAAVVLRDGGCAFPGCDRPSRWCQIHHIQFWARGGRTDRDNGVALCGYHHRLIHQNAWTIRLAADRRPEFIPPAYLDPERRPRRNPYHPRR
jgi:Domain of unknown function (DUF222)/HNH endonuclease